MFTALISTKYSPRCKYWAMRCVLCSHSYRLPRAMRPPQELDIEDSWDYIDRDWDYIHLRMLYGSISCWERLYSKIFRQAITSDI